MKTPNTTNTVIVVPAYNEELSLGSLLDEIHRDLPGHPVLVINDGSGDETADVALRHGAEILNLPYNAGVGTAVQAGFQYAWRHGFDYVLRLDGDGQHPPAEVRKLMDAMRTTPCDLVLGTRFGATDGMVSTRLRYFGAWLLARFLSVICRARVTDPTSGFWLVNRRLTYVFAHLYPSDYPEPEALALLRRLGYTFRETPARFRCRVAGQSSIGRWDTVFHAFKVVLALFVGRLRPVDGRYSFNRLRLP